MAAVRVAVGIVRQGERFLVGERQPGQALPGYAEFPGGKLHPDESPKAGVLREIAEETGLAAETGHWTMEVEHIYPHGHCLITFVECRCDDRREPRPPFRWLTLSEVEALRFPEGNAAMWERYRRERIGGQGNASPRDAE